MAAPVVPRSRYHEATSSLLEPINPVVASGGNLVERDNHRPSRAAREPPTVRLEVRTRDGGAVALFDTLSR